MAERKISVSLEGRMDNLSRTLQRAEAETEKHTRAMDGSFRRVDGGILAVGSSLGSLAGAAGISGAAVTAFGYQLIQAGLAAEKLQMQFKATTGSTAAADKELGYVRELSDRLGLSFQSTAGAYGKFLGATRNTAIEGAPAKKVFEGVSEAVTALGLDADESSGIFLALSQMMSKGKVSAEELTGQLGERLPGALNLAADAMGLTTTELLKQMQEGRIMSSDLLPKLAEELHKTYGTAAQESAQKGQAGINRFNNEVRETAAAIGEDLLPALNKLANWGAGGLKTLRENPQGPLDHVMRAIAWAQTGKLVMDTAPPTYGNVDPQMSRIEADRRSEQERANARKAATDRAAAAAEAARKQAAEATRKQTEHQRQLNEGMKVGAEMVQLYYKELEDLAAIQREIALDRWRADAEAEGNSEGRLNYYGRMSDRQQASFDQRSMESGWAARNSESDREAEAYGASFSAFRAGANGDPFAETRLQLQQDEAAWVQHWAMMTDSEDEYERRRTEIAAVYAAERAKLDQTERQMKIASVTNTFSYLADAADAFSRMSSQKSKAEFKRYQDMQRGITVVSTASGIMQVWSDTSAGTWYEKLAKSAAIAAQGAAQLSAISGARYEGGGGGASGASGSSSSYSVGGGGSQMVTQPFSKPAMNSVTINLQMGDVYGDDRERMAKWFEEQLAPVINDATTRNITILN